MFAKEGLMIEEEHKAVKTHPPIIADHGDASQGSNDPLNRPRQSFQKHKKTKQPGIK